MKGEYKNIFFVVAVFMAAFLLSAQAVWAQAEDVSILESEREALQDELASIEQEIDSYQGELTTKQQEISSLNNQIAIVNARIGKLNAEIKKTQTPKDCYILTFSQQDSRCRDY